jgi:hypothetical protein
LIGARTLALLRQAGASALHQTIKVPRREVQAIVVSLVVHLVSHREIETIFNRAKL